ncbi:MAG: hypothetical protein ABSH14_17115 [Verrucomicrobiia bacterium]|jgi:hypothetical protein
MDEESKVRRAAWRAQARADLRRPRTWLILASLYVATFLLVAGVMFVLDLIVPHLPWISKPYVSPDPPPLVTAFYCANLVPALVIVVGLLLYCFYDPKRMESRKKS